MTRGFKYFGLIISIFAVSTLGLSILFYRYGRPIFEHLSGICHQTIKGSFFLTGHHFIAFLILAVLLLTAISFLIKATFSLVKTRQKIKRLINFQIDQMPQKLQLLCEKHKLAKDKIVVINQKSSRVFCFGLSSSKLLVSTAMIRLLSIKQLEAVILHEWHHLQHHHALILFINETIASTLFFLPAIKHLAAQAYLSLEQEADTFAVKRQQTSKHLRLALAKTLNIHHRQYRFCPAFASDSFKQRVAGLLEKKAQRPTVWEQKLFLSLGSVLAGFLLLILPIRNHPMLCNLPI